jgi:cardiolipin synthase
LQILNVPNAITLLRFALIPVIALQLLRHDYGTAFALFIVSALSDLADGVVARRWSLRTRFGAIADPLADKLTMLTVALVLAMQSWLAWWFAAAVVTRDLVIVGGAIAYRLRVGPLEIAPTRLSKLNTALEFLLLTSILAIGAGLVDDGPWRQALLVAAFVTVVSSGTHYVLVWSRKAAQARSSSR